MSMTIRLAGEDDGVALAAIYGPSVTHAATSFELEPPDGAEMARRVRAILEHAPWLVLDAGGGDLLGFAYGTRHRERAAYQWSCDVTVYVRDDQHRRGVGRRLYEALFGMLRVQGFCAAHAGITLPNAASVGLHESLGFRPVGVYERVGYKQGAWHDVGWWQLELRARQGAPPPLLSREAALAAGAADYMR